MTEYFISSPIGVLKLIANEVGLEAIHFAKNKKPSKKAKMPKVILQTEKWLNNYFKGKITQPPTLVLNGTQFQNQIWEKMLEIEPGQTKTYGELAKEVGRPKAARAVGQACNVNPLAIIVPCHRVVGRAGLTGYAGGLGIKKKLLALESRFH